MNTKAENKSLVYMANGRSQLSPRVLSTDSENWCKLAAEYIEKDIITAIDQRGICNVMLTGGNTAKSLYSYWAKNHLLPLENIHYYFGDERCVPAGHIDSNHAMTMKTLFPNGLPIGCTINKIEADNTDKEAAANRYEELLPDVIDVLLLGLGTDGHVASIFPNSPVLKSNNRKAMYVQGPNAPKERITITPKVILEARSVFLLATGEDKGCILKEALNSLNEIEKLPVCLTLNGTWLLDKDAACSAQVIEHGA